MDSSNFYVVDFLSRYVRFYTQQNFRERNYFSVKHAVISVNSVLCDI